MVATLQRFAQFLVFLLTTLILLLFVFDPQSAAAENGALPTKISLVCTTDPQEHGIALHREGLAPETVNVDGKDYQAWVSRQKSVPVDEWARSFCMTITDPAFKNGAMPVVDIEITYLHEGNTKVELVADTADGSKVVASAWGNQRKWQTIHCQLSNAQFGARKFGNDPKSLPVDGYDLRLNAWAADFRLLSVTIVGNDRKNPSDWSRFITVDKVDSQDKFIVSPGDKDTLTFSAHNRALIDAKGKAHFDIFNSTGKLLKQDSRDISLQKNAVTKIDYMLATDGLPTGELSVRFGFDLDDKRIIGYEQTEVVAGPNDIFIVFDQTPIMRGVDFERNAIEPRRINVNGLDHWIWATTGNQKGGDQWWNSAYFTVTDPRFKNGAMPAVDLWATYRHLPNAPLNLTADCANGARQVAGGWGNNPNWQTMWCQIDDAKFGATAYPGNDPKALLTDGCDIRFNNCNDAGELRSIFIHGYDRSANPDYGRLLRFDGMDAGRELFIFNPGEKTDLQMKLRNLALLDLHADVAIKLMDDFGNVLWQRNQITVIKPGPFQVPVAFDTAGLKQGVYTLALTVGRTMEGHHDDLFSTATNLMVSDQKPIAKARSGEYLYGCDAGVDYHDDRFFQWLDFMGVDITRGNCANGEHPDEWAAAYEVLDKHHLRSTAFSDQPWDSDPAKLDQKIAENAERAAGLEKQFGSHIMFWELGNEPDLTFFYAGPIESYAKAATATSKAIHDVDPNAKVMNGGLCFASADADFRARKLVEIIPTEAIDVWAYHGHGPNAQAERFAYDRMYGVANQFNKANRPFLETESGVSAHTPSQIRVQARTAVEKSVYAQSVHLPTLMWFRLLITGGDADYTNLLNVHEPRPCVLSYRTMVKTLRGHTYVKNIDLQDQDSECYLFAQNGGAGRAMVLWSNASGGETRTVLLSPHARAISDVKLIDLFGNVTPIANPAAGIITVPIDPDPAFLVWKTSDNAADVTVLPSPLNIASAVNVTPGGKDVISLIVRNASSDAMNATLTIKSGSGTGLSPAEQTFPIIVPAEGELPVTIPVTVADSSDAVVWPQHWKVFTDTPANAIDPANFKSIPDKIEGTGKTIYPQVAKLRNDRLDLASIAGFSKEKSEALCFAEVNIPTDRTIHIGTSADWWVSWYIDGQHVWDDLDTGNAGAQGILEHGFDVSLKSGKHLLAVRVLSGSQGWALTCGGPEEVAAAKGQNGAGNLADVELRQGDAILARQRVQINRRHLIKDPQMDLQAGGPMTLNAIEPDAELSEEGIVNEFAKQPDSNKWWKGSKDLSGRCWVRADAKRVYVIVAVTDDVHKPATDAAGIDVGDALQLAIATRDGKIMQLGVPAGGVGVFDRDSKNAWIPVAAAEISAKVDRVETGDTGITWYRIAIDRSVIHGKTLSCNLLINDNDWGAHKQSGGFFPGIDNAGKDSAITQRWWQGVLK